MVIWGSIHPSIHDQFEGRFSPWELFFVSKSHSKLTSNWPQIDYTKATVIYWLLIWPGSAWFIHPCLNLQLPFLWISLGNTLFVISLEQSVFWRHTCTIKRSITYISLATRLAYSTTSARPTTSLATSVITCPWTQTWSQNPTLTPPRLLTTLSQALLEAVPGQMSWTQIDEVQVDYQEAHLHSHGQIPVSSMLML